VAKLVTSFLIGAFMKFIANRAALLDATETSMSVVRVRTPKPILACCLIEASMTALRITATDMERRVTTSVEEVQVEQAGDCTVECEALRNILKQHDDDVVTVKVQHGDFILTFRDSQFKLVVGPDVKDFPPEPLSGDDSVKVSVPASVLDRMFKQVEFAAAKESTRYAFNGLLMDIKGLRLRCVATDGRRMAMSEHTMGADMPPVRAIVPRDAVRVILQMEPSGDVEITIDPSRAVFVLDRVRFGTCLIEGQFPPYDDIIPSDPSTTATMAVESFESAVRRGALLCTEESKGCRFDFTPKGTTIHSRSPGSGEATVEHPCQVVGPAMEIGFNPQYLMDGLGRCGADEVTLSLAAPNRPGVLRCPGWTYVVMPVNLH
jgi:DNA polymerase III subunit beta